MKMLSTSTPADPTEYPAHVHNCLRNAACELPYVAPLPGIPYLQLYVDFGTFQPVMVEFQLVDPCDGNAMHQLFPNNYVIGKTPEGGFYGVFKYFSSPLVDVSSFVVWLSATNAELATRTYFTQMIGLENCLPLTKIKSCQPELATTTGFDINGVYYGLPDPEEDILGVATVRYFHIAWVRHGKVRELSNKGTFKSSLTRNFRTTIEKIFQIETELVPQWYKNVLLAIYSRGAVQINDATTYLVSDLAVEPINDDDLTWKPFAQVKETYRLFFGCDVSECFECCSPVVLHALTTSTGGGGSASEPPGPGDDEYTISYTNNQLIPIALRIHNNGIGALTAIYVGNYTPDPVNGVSLELPAVDALVTFTIGGGKVFTLVSCNGVPNPSAVGNSSSSWVHVNGPLFITFITN